MGIVSCGLTDIGQKRTTNQDSIYLNPKKNFFLVADGMGGHQGGDVASSIAVKVFPESFFKQSKDSLSQALKAAINDTNLAIFNRAQEESQLKGMGTTAVCLYFKDTHAYVANVGDSRCYMINKKNLYQLSRDHSVIYEKLYHGIYDREQAQADTQKNALARSVGFEDAIQSDVFSYKVARGDIFLLCSDGLHGLVSEKNIVEVVNHFIPDPLKTTEEAIQKATETLIALANHNGGKDNISVILVCAK